MQVCLDFILFSSNFVRCKVLIVYIYIWWYRFNAFHYGCVSHVFLSSILFVYFFLNSGNDYHFYIGNMHLIFNSSSLTNRLRLKTALKIQGLIFPRIKKQQKSCSYHWTKMSGRQIQYTFFTFNFFDFNEHWLWVIHTQKKTFLDCLKVSCRVKIVLKIC